MDGSASSVSSMQDGHHSSRRPKIIGGIIGGAVGLVLLLLCVHCIVISVRRKRCRQATQDNEFYDIEAAKRIRQTQTRKGSLRNPKKLSIATDRLRTMKPFPTTTRPLPREPQSAPSLSEKIVQERRDMHGGVMSAQDADHFGMPQSIAEPSVGPFVGAQRPGSARILQELRTPQAPPPRMTNSLRPNSDDPFA